MGITQFGVLYGLMAGACWGFSFLIPKFLSGISPSEIAWGRFEWFGFFSLIALYFQKGFRKNAPVWRYWKKALPLALAGYSLYYLLLVNSIQRIGIPIPSLLVGLIPVTVSLLSREAVRRPWLFYTGLLCIVFGMGILNRQAFLSEPAFWRMQTGVGMGMALVCLVLWSYFAFANANFLKVHPEVDSREWSSVLGVYTALATLVLDSLVRVFRFESEVVTRLPFLEFRFLACTAFLGLVSTFFATRLWNRASLVLPTGLAAQLIVSETVFALIYSFVYESRFPKVAELFAIFFVMGGILLAIRAHQVIDERDGLENL